MLIITSAAYVPQDLVADIGQIPPAFLPLRNRPLYWWQLASLSQCPERTVITVPSDFVVDPWDLTCIEQAGATLFASDPEMGLAESLLSLLFEFPLEPGETLKLLHGDTLLESIPWEIPDAVAAAANDGYYQRAQVGVESGKFGFARYRYCAPGDVVLSGYFSFTDGGAFREVLREAGEFIPAVNAYAASRGGVEILHIDEWSDCGHVNAYYRSRARHTGARSFNYLEPRHYFIRKRSSNEKKIAAEMKWFGDMPAAMRHYFPQIGETSCEHGQVFYDVEYLHCLPLSDAFVYGRLSIKDWEIILHRCKEFVADCVELTPQIEHEPLRGSMFLQKTEKRLLEFAEESGWDIKAQVTINGVAYPSLGDLARIAQEILDGAEEPVASLVHGDLCFSNILYDMRAQRIKVIDPRGLDSTGEMAALGDPRYDLAKLFHSIVGGYDFVVAGRLVGDRTGTSHELRIVGELPDRVGEVREVFLSLFRDVFDRYGGEAVIAAATIHLFLSMLPLHADDASRQYALMARAYALALQYDLVATA